MSEKKILATVAEGGVIRIADAALPVGQTVEVTIRSIQSKPRVGRVSEILARMPGHRLFKTAEEVDAYIRRERDSWER